MEYVPRILAGTVLAIFVLVPICMAIGALVIHLWHRVRNARNEQKDKG